MASLPPGVGTNQCVMLCMRGVTRREVEVGLLRKLGRLAEAAALCKEAVEHEPDQWASWTEWIDLAFALAGRKAHKALSCLTSSVVEHNER
jgi:hypothetical protein